MYRAIRTSFLSKIKALEKEQEEIQRKHRSVKDWYDLIVEAEMVFDNNIHEVSIKYIESSNISIRHRSLTIISAHPSSISTSRIMWRSVPMR